MDCSKSLSPTHTFAQLTAELLWVHNRIVKNLGNSRISLAKIENEGTLGADHLGSVRLVVRADTGAIAQAISYDEFGRVLSDSSPGFQAFGFAGGDTNLYGYVLNDPIKLVDPSGLWGVQIGVSVGGIFPAMGAGGEAGIAMTHSANSGFQLGGYTPGHAKARAGIFGGFGVNFNVTPSAQSVSNLGGAAAGINLDTPAFGFSLQFSDQGGRASPTYGLGFGLGGLGAVYGTVGYTSTSTWFSSGSASMCGAH